MEPRELPAPDSDELRDLGLGAAQRAIYRLLYESRGTPLTMLEIRDRLRDELGTQEQLDRRRRDLNRFFVIEKHGSGTGTAYELVGRRAANESASLGISERVRAEVLRLERCAMCGRTPREHGVVLEVDHKMPQSWGGTNDIDNLQPLCQECNRGKKAYFATLDQYGEAIRAAADHDEPHRRIGEILRAFAPDEVRSDVIELVAHSKQYQEDWQKRLRELRELGWVIRPRRKRDESGRVRVYWRAEVCPPWPEGNLRAEISRRERAKKSKPPELP